MRWFNLHLGERCASGVRMGRLVRLGGFGVAVGCASVPIEDERGEARMHVVYGTDDRGEVYDEPSETLAEIARESVVALISHRWLTRQPDGTWNVESENAAERHGLCLDERYSQQVAAADCSGTLIAEDWVLTAGHCVWSESKCRSYAFAFNYFYRAPGELASIDDNAVYQCKRLVFVDAEPGGDAPVDLAIVQLDRSVQGFRPAALAPSSQVPLRTALVLIGTTAGIPIKIDRGGRVQSYVGSPSRGFKANVDSFVGSSGSGLFSSSGSLVGVLSRGQNDYRMAGDCKVSRVLDDTLGDETSYWAELAVSRLCEDAEAPRTLCGEPLEDASVTVSMPIEPSAANEDLRSRGDLAAGCSVSAPEQTGRTWGGGICWLVSLFVLYRRMLRSRDG